MFLTIIYAAMTFLKTWRIRAFRTRLLEYLNENTSVAFRRISEHSEVTPTLSSLLCTNSANANIDKYHNYMNNKIIYSMIPSQYINIDNWIAYDNVRPISNKSFSIDNRHVGCDHIQLLIECDLDSIEKGDACFQLEDYGEPVAWRADKHLAVIINTNIELMSCLCVNFLINNVMSLQHYIPLMRVQSVHVKGKPIWLTETKHRQLKSEIQNNLKLTRRFNWHHHTALLRKLTKSLEIKNRSNENLNLEKNYLSASAYNLANNISSLDNSMVEVPLSNDNLSDDRIVITEDFVKNFNHDNVINETLDTLNGGELLNPALSRGYLQGNSITSDNIKCMGSLKRSHVLELSELKGTTDNGVLEIFNVSESSDMPESSNVSETSSVRETPDLSENQCVKFDVKHTLTPKKSGLRLDLKKSFDKSASLISSQIKSLTTHKRIISLSPKKRKDTESKSPKKESEKQLSPKKTVEKELSPKKTVEKELSPKKTVEKELSPKKEPEKELSPKKTLEKELSPKKAPSPKKELPPKNVTSPKKELSPIKVQESQAFTAKREEATPKLLTHTNGHLSSHHTSSNDKSSDMTDRKKSRGQLVHSKWPNVIIYSESAATRDNLESTLKDVLDCERYTVYQVTWETLENGAWRGKTHLVVIGGDVSGRASTLLLGYFLSGGRLLALCSNVLYTLLPYYKTAEVRENEIVNFTYDKWHNVSMKHHIFCYQASPAKKQFSTESDKQSSIYNGHPGHDIQVEVVATEQTWNTPSLITARDTNNGGLALFSQVHLEADPASYLGTDAPLDSNETRLNIVRHIMSELLDMEVGASNRAGDNVFTRAFFLGDHVRKASFLDALLPTRDVTAAARLECGHVTLEWYNSEPASTDARPTDVYLPIMMHQCPEHFSTYEYFNNLTSEHLGRLVIYSDVMTSSQDLITSREWTHGLAIVPRSQTKAKGRSGNRWLSPVGCAMISLQVGRVTSSQHAALAQHAAALAAVTAVRSKLGYTDIPINIKWPNDIYYGRDVKIGGVVVNANFKSESDIVLNIGVGVNISNNHPTECINNIINKYNSVNKTDLQQITLELYLARFCSELEHILNYMKSDGGVDAFIEQYYKYWLHTNEPVTINKDGVQCSGKIVGIDHYGYIKVMSGDSVITLQPDGNTFDMMNGLIATKEI